MCSPCNFQNVCSSVLGGVVLSFAAHADLNIGNLRFLWCFTTHAVYAILRSIQFGFKDYVTYAVRDFCGCGTVLMGLDTSTEIILTEEGFSGNYFLYHLYRTNIVGQKCLTHKQSVK